MSHTVLSTLGGILASAVSTPLGAFLSQSIQNYQANRKANKIPVQCVLINSPTDAQHLINTYNTEFGNSSTLYLLDVEQAVMVNPANASFIDQLNQLKQNNITQYDIVMCPLALTEVSVVLQHLVSIKSDQTLVVFVSDITIKRYLSLTNSFYFAPSVALFKTYLSNHPQLAKFLQRSRDILDSASKEVIIFNNADELYSLFLNTMGVVRTL